MEEIWKPIKDFENYEVSNMGRVKNIKTNRVLRNNIKDGYESVSLVGINIKKSFKVHRLVAIAFLENPENKTDVNHKDKNKLNNILDNLEWMTRKENNTHRCKDTTIIQEARNRPIKQIDSKTNLLLRTFNSIEDAGIWSKENNFTKTVHNGRNAIGNCLRGLSKLAYGCKWEYELEQHLENEIWKKIPFAKKDCQVSNLGRFKNSNGIILTKLKPCLSGYHVACIDSVTYRLHRLVAMTFLENPDNKEQVNHIDGNKTNNAVSNLEWVTNKENQLHKIKTGLGNCFTRKVGQYNIETCEIIKEYNSIVLASKEVNINKSCIQGVLQNRGKTAGGFIWKYLD
jgi:hypothetical protein